jgi:amino acid adenylation domain-containing protein
MTDNISKRIVSHSQNIENERSYWSRVLEGELKKTNFPYDYNLDGGIKKTNENSNKKDKAPDACITFKVEHQLTRKLMKITNGSENNMFVILLAGYSLLLSRYTGNDDILVAVPIYKQEREGEFINTVLAIRNRLHEDRNVKELLMQTRKLLFEANENLNYPLERLLGEIDGDIRLETAIMMENIHNKEYIRHLEPTVQFNFRMENDALEANVRYYPHLYQEETIERVSEHYQNILQTMVNRLDSAIIEIDVLTADQKQSLQESFNGKTEDIPADKTIHGMFEEQAQRNPSATAVVFGTEDGTIRKLTYGELNSKANQVARQLEKNGLKPGDIVGIMMDPAAEIPLAIMAVLKTGAAYLPMDPEFPENRILYMLQDSQTRHIITQKQHKERFNALQHRLNIWDIDDPENNAADDSDRESVSTPESLLYTIFTSGTTGKPKGVLLKNKNLVNYVTWFTKEIGITSDDRSILISSFAYDLGYTAVYPSLLSGGQLHICPRDTYLSPESLLEYMQTEGITYIKLTPSLFTVILANPRFNGRTLPSLRQVVLGGEAINTADVETTYERFENLRIMNHYGPTETTIGAVAQQISRQRMDEYKRIPTIGKPIYNTGVYILDRNRKYVPVGVPAELCIGGCGVGEGYLNRPELTARKFIQNSHIDDNTKIYRTGDLARWRADGTIEFLGRIDQQVKIRGYRIELGEIENQLKRHKWVKDALVIDIGKGKEKYLCGYVVSTPEGTIAGEGLLEKELKTKLTEELPDYMVPRHCVMLEDIPLTPNGKVDRKKLPEPRTTTQNKNTAPPETALEKQLVEIWRQLLELPEGNIGIDDSFFELGGHSLKAIMLISRIHKEMDVKIPLTEMFIIATIRKLAKYIEEAETDKYQSIQPTEEREYYPVSSAQMRLYILQEMKPDDSSYNIPRILRVDGELDEAKLESVVVKLMKRHEGLRTVFRMHAGKPVQEILPQVDFAIEQYDAQEGEEEKIIRQFVRPFDLSRAPLLRLGVMKTDGKPRLLMVDMHHIISDGVTIGLVIEDMVAIYGEQQLDPLYIRYKDYSQWQQSEAGKESVAKQKAFWLKQFKGDVPVLNLPTDYERPVEKSFEGNHIPFEIGKTETAALRKLALEQETTMYMVLLAVFKILLARISGQEDLVVGLPTAGRRHSDLQRIVGVFVNTLALRSAPEPGKTLIDFIGEITSNTLKAFENQDYQFEELVEKISVNRDVSRNPLFDVLFILQNMEIPELTIPGLTLEPYENETRVARFDLSMMGMEAEDTLFFTVEYGTSLFREETVRKFIDYFQTVVTALIETPDQKIGDIQLLTESEKQWIVAEINATEAVFPAEKTLYRMFLEQVERTPGNTALIENGRQLSYRQLQEKSRQLGTALREKGVAPNTITAVKIPRSLEMMVAIYGILAAGGAYLPIDPENPQERIDYMLNDSNAVLQLTEEDVRGYADPETPVQNSDPQLETAAAPTDLSYIIYTSGSTGRPKGVMIENRAAVNRLNWMQKNYPIGETDVILQKTTIAFDVSVWELFWWSRQGAAVSLLAPGEEKNPEAIIANIEKHTVTTMHFVPSMLNIFLEYVGTGIDINRMKSLRQVFASGEELTPYHANRFNKQFNDRIGTKLINLYGPTEATVDVSNYDIPTGEIDGPIPIGKPIDNIQLYILNKNHQLQPPGITGQLCIAGVGLARGYLNRPVLTTEKFMTIPIDDKPTVIYQTGDLAVRQPDGNILYLGRMDHQVKIRGFRIELGEIENQLQEHPGIKQAVVQVEKDKKGDGLLTAYVVPESTADGQNEINTTQLKEHLAHRLTDYMIPARYVKLDNVPLTANGKVDRNALRTAGDDMGTGVRYIAPKNETEKIIARIWAEELGLEKVGTQESFFELGGTSLKIIQTNLRLKEELQRNIPVVAMFRYPKISQLAQYIEKADTQQQEQLTADQRTNTVQKGKSKLKNLRKRMRTG